MKDNSSMETRNLKRELKSKISEYLKRKFTVTSYSESKEYPNQYEVEGTIRRYGQLTHVRVSVDKNTLQPDYWLITDSKITMPSEWIGHITLSENACVSDPCYDRDVWCMTHLHTLKPGRWEVYASIDTIDSWGKRVYILKLHHTEARINESAWIQYSTLGVDSGQMSVFDDPHYLNKKGGAEYEAFYKACCDITLGGKRIGLFYAGDEAVGVVCSSGCGDGCYPLNVILQGDEIVAMEINFM